MNPTGCPIDMEERRRDGDRIIRLETVVERIESDVSTLTATYKEIAAQQHTMFVENLKSQGALQSVVQELTRTIQEQNPRVVELEGHIYGVKSETAKIADLEKKVNNLDAWKWRVVGLAAGVTVTVQVLMWFWKM